ncbi:MAG: DegT/DnrJ/EryC1/StrS family aminotransferase, partial [Candidatus Cloacimonetes bacterium]|nr:DegT/DnrJ/EryC1/StrS family aminotransferase [Candidatus Cloacimonadota bacterium]
MKIPVLDLHAQYEPILDEIKAEIEKVYKSHWYILGPQVKELEAEMQAYLDVKYAIGCASGSDAIVLALKACGIGVGNEVITTPFTFFATAGAIVRVGAKPVFADIDPDTYNLSPEAVEQAITDKTKAIMPVHLFGQAADMDAIMDIARKHSLYVIEDNAQGVGAKYKEHYTGAIGDIGTLSFFPSKNLGAMGDAGMCLTNNEELADRLRQLRVHGENPKYFHKWVGLNSRLDTIQAAVLLVKLKHLSAWTEARRKNADKYFAELSDIKQLKLPFIAESNYMIYNQFTLYAERRDELMKHLHNAGVGCAIYYPLPLHLQECFADLGGSEGDFPVSEAAAKHVLSIPVFSEMTESQQKYIIE